MDQYKKQAVAAFESFGRTNRLEVSNSTDTSVDIVGCEIGLRVHWRVERMEGIFITLFRMSVPANEYSLVYLIEFENGKPEDINLAQSNNVTMLVDVAKRYCTKYLVGNTQDFQFFVEYANRRIAEQVHDIPEIKATKWIRPEW